MVRAVFVFLAVLMLAGSAHATELEAMEWACAELFHREAEVYATADSLEDARVALQNARDCFDPSTLTGRAVRDELKHREWCHKHLGSLRCR